MCVLLAFSAASGVFAQEPEAVKALPVPQGVALENAILDAVNVFDSGNLEEAEAMFGKISAADSTNDAALYYLGMCRYGAEDIPAAEAYLSKAAALDSTNSWYRNILARLYMEAGDIQKAVPLMEGLVNKFPQFYNTPYILTMIADNQVKQYHDSSALVYYNRALDLDPGYAPAEMGKAELLRMKGNNPGFFASLARVVENRDVVSDAKSSYLQSLMDHIDSKTWWVWGKEICRLIDVCTELDPDDIKARWLKVNTCAINDDWDGVLDQCREIVRISGEKNDSAETAKAYSTMGDIFHEYKNDEKSCFEMYERALKADPRYVPVLNNYAYYLSLKGTKLRKALKMSAITIEEEPDNATYLDTYGWILHLLGKNKEAKPYFKHALIYGGRDSKVILEHYAEVLGLLGEQDLADYYLRLASEKE